MCVCVRVCRGKDDRDRREEEDEESYPVLYEESGEAIYQMFV